MCSIAFRSTVQFACHWKGEKCTELWVLSASDTSWITLIETLFELKSRPTLNENVSGCTSKDCNDKNRGHFCQPHMKQSRNHVEFHFLFTPEYRDHKLTSIQRRENLNYIQFSVLCRLMQKFTKHARNDDMSGGMKISGAWRRRTTWFPDNFSPWTNSPDISSGEGGLVRGGILRVGNSSSGNCPGKLAKGKLCEGKLSGSEGWESSDELYTAKGKRVSVSLRK